MAKSKLMNEIKVNNAQESNVISLMVTKLKFGNYQKKLNKNLVQKIIKEFNIDRMRPIEVSYRDGFYWVFDGQHRVAAYLEMGIKLIPCQVHYGLSYEEEAVLFAKQQENVGRITVAHKWNALVEAKDIETMKTVEVAGRLGYTIDTDGGKKRNNIVAVKSIMDIVSKLELNGLYDILTVTRKCWDGQTDAVNGEMLNGLKTFMLLYGKCAEFNMNTLIKKLKGLESSLVLVRAKSDATTKNKSVRVAKVIYHTYNENLREKNRLPYKFNC